VSSTRLRTTAPTAAGAWRSIGSSEAAAATVAAVTLAAISSTAAAAAASRSVKLSWKYGLFRPAARQGLVDGH
jgi:hypothetical protein